MAVPAVMKQMPSLYSHFWLTGLSQTGKRACELGRELWDNFVIVNSVVLKARLRSVFGRALLTATGVIKHRGVLLENCLRPCHGVFAFLLSAFEFFKAGTLNKLIQRLGRKYLSSGGKDHLFHVFSSDPETTTTDARNDLVFRIVY